MGTRARADINGDRGLPIFGNLFQLLAWKDDLLGYLLDQFKRHGNVSTFTLPGVGRFIDVNTPEAIEYIQKSNFENYEKGEFVVGVLEDFLGKSVFVSNGLEWRMHRKAVSKIFTVRLYRDLVQHVFKESAKEIGQVFEKYVAHTDASYCDLQYEFIKLTLGTVGMATFGHDFKILSTEGHTEFGDAFDYMTNRLDSRINNPLWRLTEWMVPSLRNKIVNSISIVNKYAFIAIKKRRKETPEQKAARPRDMLDYLIGHKYQDGSFLTDEELRNVFCAFMFASRTTSHGLTWMFYLLKTHPEVEAKLMEEIDLVFQGSEEYTYETLTHDLPYTKAVFYETLRLYPPVPKNTRVAVDDDVLPDGTKIYKGDIVGYSAYCMGRNTEVWGPNAAEFVPERWLMPVDDKQMTGKSPFGKFKNESMFKFNSFNAGPRICLGQTFATLEVMVTIVYTLQHFRFELEPNHPVLIPKNSVTLLMAGTLRVCVFKRDDKTEL
ncbi:hypothetical protein BGZ88_011697 [Linnemannia elongata]|nr:hypothetical protein BGZ88_011697 [Linnemannia elongata]